MSGIFQLPVNSQTQQCDVIVPYPTFPDIIARLRTGTQDIQPDTGAGTRAEVSAHCGRMSQTGKKSMHYAGRLGDPQGLKFGASDFRPFLTVCAEILKIIQA